MKIKPLGKNIVIRKIIREEKTDTGIFLPTSHDESYLKGKVISVGSVKEVQIGDVVILRKHAGSEISSELMVIKEEEILGIVE